MREFTFEARGRSRKALITLTLIYAVLLALTLLIDMSPYIAGVLALFTLPLVYEVITNPTSGLALDEHQLSWHSQRSDDRVLLVQLLRVRFDTRLDLSVRVTLILKDGRKIRLPHAAVPPHYAFEDALKARGITTERHHFSLIG